MNRQLWIDFNSVDENNRTHSLTRFANDPDQLVIGSRIVVGDDEGMCTWAEVIDTHADGRIDLQLA